MARDMPKPCKFPSFDRCQKRFLSTHKEAGLAPHPVVGLVFHVRDVEEFPQALVSKAWKLSAVDRVWLVGWCFEPSQPREIISLLKVDRALNVK